MEVPPRIGELVATAHRVTVLTGAGMSAESGVPTFREAQSGLWARFDAERLATEDAFRRDPALVFGWYLWRLDLVRGAAPNAGHRALADWAGARDIRLVTQNVDDLHERAGSDVLAHLHGSLADFRCSGCGTPYLGPLPASSPAGPVEPPACAACGAAVRPGVVWFGEALPALAFASAVQACRDADLVVVVGTSGLVYPAAGLPDVAAAEGIPVIEINPTAAPITADHRWAITAARGLPLLAALATT